MQLQTEKKIKYVNYFLKAICIISSYKAIYFNLILLTAHGMLPLINYYIWSQKNKIIIDLLMTTTKKN